MDYSELMSMTVEASDSTRLLELEERGRQLEPIGGDWQGTRQGYWVKLNDDNTGTVSVGGNQYVTVIKSWTSIAAGTPVTVTASGGKYYSSW